LEGIQLGIRVGITAEERETPQPCRLDLVLKADLEQAGQSGDLKKTVDYVSILSCVEEICTQQSFTLLEEIAQKTRPFSDKLSSVGVQFKRKRRDFRK
jgi:FolB domain-containing protein